MCLEDSSCLQCSSHCPRAMRVLLRKCRYIEDIKVPKTVVVVSQTNICKKSIPESLHAITKVCCVGHRTPSHAESFRVEKHPSNSAAKKHQKIESTSSGGSHLLPFHGFLICIDKIILSNVAGLVPESEMLLAIVTTNCPHTFP